MDVDDLGTERKFRVFLSYKEHEIASVYSVRRDSKPSDYMSSISKMLEESGFTRTCGEYDFVFPNGYGNEFLKIDSFELTRNEESHKLTMCIKGTLFEEKSVYSGWEENRECADLFEKDVYEIFTRKLRPGRGPETSPSVPVISFTPQLFFICS